MNRTKQWLSEHTNPSQLTGKLSDAITGADVFVGVSTAGALSHADTERMVPDSIVFALANPESEIHSAEATGWVRVMATCRSDFPNQMNNEFFFPDLFRGLLDTRAQRVDDNMKLAAADAIAGVIGADEFHPDYIVPNVFDRRVVQAVAEAVTQVTLQPGVARQQEKPTSQVT